MLRKWIFSFLAISNLLIADVPEPYASIEVLPFDGHGWFANAAPLETILKVRQPKVVIEIGSWLGSSTRFIASLLPENAKLYAVDTWLGTPGEDVHQKDPRLPKLYQQFLSNVIHSHLENVIVPVRMKSMEAAKALKVKADLIYVDGAHDTWSVMNDILYWNLHLKEGGVMCGDDWGWQSVQAGVVECANVLNKRVYAIGNFWWYE